VQREPRAGMSAVKLGRQALYRLNAFDAFDTLQPASTNVAQKAEKARDAPFLCCVKALYDLR
jgi:hypothetical protein